MSKRMYLIQKYVVFNMLVIATQNTSASLYSILTNQIKFPPPHPGYSVFKNFPTPPPRLFQIPPPPPPRLLSFEEFFNPLDYSNPPSIRHSRV